VVVAGHSPNEFASWVLENSDVDEMLGHFERHRQSEPGDVETSDVSPPEIEGVSSTTISTPVTRPRVDPAARTYPARWTEEGFFDFLDLVGSVEDMAPSFRLLGAYVRLGPVPSSGALRGLCGFSDEGKWQTALRVAKQRLTIQARRMDFPVLFRRAKAGKEEGERLHPIQPLLFGWLKEWGRVRTESEQLEDAFPDPERWGWESSSGQGGENGE
jgi:hypothetical protein